MAIKPDGERDCYRWQRPSIGCFADIYIRYRGSKRLFEYSIPCQAEFCKAGPKLRSPCLAASMDLSLMHF